METDTWKLAANTLLIFGPIIGFIDQYRIIQKTKSSEGFSTFTSFILLTSAIIRIFYWFGNRFSIIMLYQAIVMIIAQCFMLQICVKYPSAKARGNSIFGNEIRESG